MSSQLPMQPRPPSALAELSGWWKAELIDALRRLSRRKVRLDEEFLPDITITRDGLQLGPEKGPPFALEALSEKSKEVFGRRGLPRLVTIALDERRFLRRKLADHRIPLVHAQRMAELDVETQTPFKLDTVYILFPDAPASDQAFHYYLVRRDFLDPLLAGLRASKRKLGKLVFERADGAERAAAFAVDALDGGGGRLLQHARRHALALACSLLIGYAGYNVTAALARDLSTVDKAISEIAPRAKAARAAFRKHSDYLDRIRAIHGDQHAYIPVVTILEEMSSTLPDATYLTGLSMRQGKVKITGFSADAAALIALLESSSVFANPRFMSAVVRAPGGNTEQFDLEVEVAHAR